MFEAALFPDKVFSDFCILFFSDTDPNPVTVFYS